MKVIILIIQLHFVFFAVAQSDSITVNSTVKVLAPAGSKIKTKTIIFGKEYTFTDLLCGIPEISSDKSAVLVTKSHDYSTKGIFFNFDLDKGKSIWNTKKSLNASILIDSNTLFLGDKNGFLKLENDTGKELYSKNATLLHISKKNNLALARSDAGALSKQILIYSINNGKLISNFFVENKNALEYVYHNSNGDMLVSCGELIYINHRNEVVWRHTQKTKKTYTAKIIGDILTAGILASFNDYIMLSIEPYTLNGLRSNPLFDNNKIYTASYKKLECLSLNGTIIWSIDLEEGLSNWSKIFIRGDKLYMLNTGIAVYGGKFTYYGDVQLSYYDTSTGKRLGVNRLESDDEDIKIVDYKIDSNYLFTVMNNGISVFNLDNGVRFLKKTIQELKCEALVSIDSNRYYIRENNGFKLWKDDSSYLTINTKSKTILLFDKNLKLINKASNKHLFKILLSYHVFHFIEDENFMYVLDRGDVVAKFKRGLQYKIHNDKLYIRYERSLMTINLNEALLDK